jgi:hypothetical protein
MASKRKCGHCGLQAASVLSTRVWGLGLSLCDRCFVDFMGVLDKFTPHREVTMPKGAFLAVKHAGR